MLNKYTLIFLLINIAAIAQSSIKSNSNTITYLSRKGVYEIQYSKDHWKKSENASEWDAEFQDNYNILNVYISEFDYFVSDKNIKSTIKGQYQKLGKIKKLKVYKKNINEMNVNYFECELEYNNYMYNFQGFLYNGKGGTMEIQFGLQEEALKQSQAIIDEFCNGIKEVK